MACPRAEGAPRDVSLVVNAGPEQEEEKAELAGQGHCQAAPHQAGCNLHEIGVPVLG